MKPTRGFTLIELLVALAIFGVIAALSVRAISNAAQQRLFVENESRKWRDLERFFSVFESDLAATTNDEDFRSRGSAPDDAPWLQLTRAGRSADDEVPVPPHAVAYRLTDGRISRTTGVDAEAKVMRFPNELIGLSVRFLSAQHQWRANWAAGEATLPRAIELQLQLSSRESVRRVFLVR